MTETKLYLVEGVTPDKSAVKELKEFLRIEDTVEGLKQADGFMRGDCRVDKVIVTPDFHKGAGIPIGTVALTDGFIIP